jgi:hypothetical protein
MLEAFLRIIEGQPADEVVWTADLAYWIHAEQRAGRADPEWDTEEGQLRLCRSLGVMPYYYYGQFLLAEPVYAHGIDVSRTDRGDRSWTRFHTPVGDLVQETVYLPTSCSTGVTKHFVTSEQDLDILSYIIEHRHLEPTNLVDYEERRRAWQRYDGFPSLALPRSPLAAFAYEWAGIQDAVFLLFDCRSKVERVFAMMAEQEGPILDAVCSASPPLVHFIDNLSSENFTSLYDRYLGPHHRSRIERLHAHGVRCAIHMDGTVRGLLPKLAASGFDSVEALTPQPVGDVTAQEMRRIAGNERMALWGGVPGAMFAPPYTWDQMRAHVLSVLDSWRGTPFVLGVADQVPPNGDIHFCRRIADLVLEQR